VLSHGLLPTTSSCARATDPNTPPLVPSFVDLLPFLLRLPTVMLPKMERSFSPHGLRMISVPEARDGGTKLSSCVTLDDLLRLNLVT
jgi:hypothetical protein